MIIHNFTVKKPEAKQFMIEEVIVSFIDILGYKKLIERYMNNLYIIKTIESLIKESTVGLLQKTRDRKFNKKVYQEYKNQISQIIGVKVIADSILFTLPISKITFSNPVEPGEEIPDCIHFYFDLITMFCTFFISKMGHVLRGGISKGPHYESDLGGKGNNFFIFSEAYVDAYLLKKEAKNPRIIAGDNFLSYLDEISFKYMDDYFYQDTDDKKCLDIYAHLNHYPDRWTVLSNIKSRLERNIQVNRMKNEVLPKLIYFAEYHNNKVNKDNLNCEDLAIDISNLKA